MSNPFAGPAEAVAEARSLPAPEVIAAAMDAARSQGRDGVAPAVAVPSMAGPDLAGAAVVGDMVSARPWLAAPSSAVHCYDPYYPAPYPYYAEPVYEAAPEYAPPPPDVYAPPPGAGAYGPPPGGGGDPTGYCAQRYRSYDPQSGTYIGNDGLRHPCP
jgi:hypothetical protein